MARKADKAKAPAKAGAKHVLRIKFGEGDHADIPLAEAERQLHRQYHQMAESDSPELQEAGKQKLREVANQTATEIVRRAGAAKGGSNKTAPAWHKECVKHAKLLLATGTERHELAGKLAPKLGKGPKAIRAVLKKRASSSSGPKTHQTIPVPSNIDRCRRVNASR